MTPTEALRYIVTASRNVCDRDNAPLGNCFQQGRTVDAMSTIDRACASCIAHKALTDKPRSIHLIEIESDVGTWKPVLATVTDREAHELKIALQQVNKIDRHRVTLIQLWSRGAALPEA